MINEEVVWVEKYRPDSVEDIILPNDVKKLFGSMVNNKTIPNLLLVGPPGIGKTTVAIAMCNELNSDYLMINGSLEGNIDTLRTKIADFASTVSFSGGRKYVIIDEADGLTVVCQPALRHFMEKYSSNCGFILTCNYPNKLIKELHSRDATIEFKIPKEERSRIATLFFKRVVNILEKENVVYDKLVIVEIVNKFFPDFRKILNELQKYSISGSINTGILDSFRGVNINVLIGLIKKKNYTECRKWISENMNNANDLFKSFYDNASSYLTPSSIPALVILIGKYQFQSAFVADQETNVMAFIAELLVEGIFE
jgi:DNA polymerase III delta prime subunit